MKYVVISYFTDLRDYDHAYNVGDEFPRQGVTVSEERIAELSSGRNKQRRPLIKAVEESGNKKTEEPKTPVQADSHDLPASPDNGAGPAAHEQTATPETPQNPESSATPVGSGEKKKYSKEDIEALKLPRIRELAGQLGFKISSTSREKAVMEFMEKQG